MQNIMLNKNIELINFEKVDNDTNISVLYDLINNYYNVVWDLQIKKSKLDYIVADKFIQRYKAEKLMEELKDFYLKDKAQKENEDREKEILWELSKL